MLLGLVVSLASKDILTLLLGFSTILTQLGIVVIYLVEEQACLLLGNFGSLELRVIS